MQRRNLLPTALMMIVLSGAVATAEESTVAKPYEPKREDCRVAPISDEAFASALQELQVLQATPRSPSGLESVDDPLEADTLSEADLPEGIPADEETVAAIIALEQEYAACFNAGEIRRAASLMTGEGLLVVVSLATGIFSESSVASPVPPPQEYQIPSVSVLDARLLPDGRAGAVVDWGPERNFVLYEKVDGQWRISDEISLTGLA